MADVTLVRYSGYADSTDKNSQKVTNRVVRRVVFNGAVVYDASVVTLKYDSATGRYTADINVGSDETVYWNDGTPPSNMDSTDQTNGPSIPTLDTLAGSAGTQFYVAIWKTALVHQTSGGHPTSYWADYLAGGFVACSGLVNWGEDIELVYKNKLTRSVPSNVAVHIGNVVCTDYERSGDGSRYTWDVTVPADAPIPDGASVYYCVSSDSGTYIQCPKGQTTTISSGFIWGPPGSNDDYLCVIADSFISTMCQTWDAAHLEADCYNNALFYCRAQVPTFVSGEDVTHTGAVPGNPETDAAMAVTAQVEIPRGIKAA